MSCVAAHFHGRSIHEQTSAIGRQGLFEKGALDRLGLLQVGIAHLEISPRATAGKDGRVFQATLIVQRGVAIALEPIISRRLVKGHQGRIIGVILSLLEKLQGLFVPQRLESLVALAQQRLDTWQRCGA